MQKEKKIISIILIFAIIAIIYLVLTIVSTEIIDRIAKRLSIPWDRRCKRNEPQGRVASRQKMFLAVKSSLVVYSCMTSEK